MLCRKPLFTSCPQTHFDSPFLSSVFERKGGCVCMCVCSNGCCTFPLRLLTCFGLCSFVSSTNPGSKRVQMHAHIYTHTHSLTHTHTQTHTLSCSLTHSNETAITWHCMYLRLRNACSPKRGLNMSSKVKQ